MLFTKQFRHFPLWATRPKSNSFVATAAQTSSDEEAHRSSLLSENQLEAELRGEDDHLDFTRDSLQKRILDHFKQLGITSDAFQHLAQAEESRRKVMRPMTEAGRLGLHSGNKELWPLVNGCSNYEKYLLNEVVYSADPSKMLQTKKLVALFGRQLEAGHGESLIRYLSERLSQKDRRKSQKGSDVFNPPLAVLALAWTDPDFPLWMMPSVGAVQIVNDLLKPEDHLSVQNYNTLTRRNNLHRLAPAFLEKFYASIKTDPLSRQLASELEAEMGISISAVRPGRRRRK